MIGSKARVTGKVTADHLIVVGTMHGPVRPTELLELQPKVGDKRYEVLEMHLGATVDGEELRPMSAAEKPGLNVVESNPG